jgi:hypothetical protein
MDTKDLADIFTKKALLEAVDNCEKELLSSQNLSDVSIFFKSLGKEDREILLWMMKIVSFNVVSSFSAVLSNMTSIFEKELELTTFQNEILNEDELLNDYIINDASKEIWTE